MHTNIKSILYCITKITSIQMHNNLQNHIIENGYKRQINIVLNYKNNKSTKYVRDGSIVEGEACQ